MNKRCACFPKMYITDKCSLKFLLQHFKLLACLYVVSYIIDTVARGKYILPGNDLNVFMTYILNIFFRFW